MTTPSPERERVAIVTDASHRIGAGVAAAGVRAGFAAVASRPIRTSGAHGLAVPGDISQADTGQRVVGQALDWFGRIDTPRWRR